MKTRWIPGREYQFSSIMKPLAAVTHLKMWHATKPNVPQYVLDYGN